MISYPSATSKETAVTPGILSEVADLKPLWKAVDELDMPIADRKPTEQFFLDTYERNGDYVFRGNGWMARLEPKTGEVREITITAQAPTGGDGSFQGKEAVFESAEGVIAKLKWNAPDLVRVDAYPASTHDPKGVQTAGNVQALFGYKVNGKSNDARGNFVTVTFKGTTGQVIGVRRETGWHYSQSETRISLEEAQKAAERAELGEVGQHTMAWSPDNESYKSPGANANSTFKTCVWCYQIVCERGVVYVDANQGRIVNAEER